MQSIDAVKAVLGTAGLVVLWGMFSVVVALIAGACIKAGQR